MRLARRCVGHDSTTLQPLSLVLKEMHMVTAIYEGNPAEPVIASLPPLSLSNEKSRTRGTPRTTDWVTAHDLEPQPHVDAEMNTMISANTSQCPHTSQPVDNADWLKTSRSSCRGRPFWTFFHHRRPMVERHAWRHRSSSTSSDTRARSESPSVGYGWASP